jgi:hypothetical protein
MDSAVGRERAKRAVTRREFIRQMGAGLLAGLVLPLSPRGLWTGPSAPSKLMDWQQGTFAALLGQDFRVDLGTRGKMAFKLVQVQAGNAKVQAGPTRLVSATAGECFMLSFLGPQKQPLLQGTYAFEQAKLGNFALFIVPGTADKSGQRYVAVVNRVRA